MKNLNFFLFAILIGFTFLTSCSDDEPSLEAGDVTIDLDHVWGTDQAPFALNRTLNHPMTGDEMTFSTFKYYMSNISLKNVAGEWISFPDNYYLVDLSEGSIVTLANVPGGEYTEVEFLLGVDSLRNVSGVQDGALAPSNGMFWSWNTGYIMLKAEGQSPQAEDGTFAFHLGGFNGENAVQTKRSFVFNGSLTVDGENPAEIHLVSNVARLWHGAASLSETSKQHMPGPLAKSMSGNYYESFIFDHIHN